MEWGVSVAFVTQSANRRQVGPSLAVPTDLRAMSGHDSDGESEGGWWQERTGRCPRLSLGGEAELVWGRAGHLWSEEQSTEHNWGRNASFLSQDRSPGPHSLLTNSKLWTRPFLPSLIWPPPTSASSVPIERPNTSAANTCETVPWMPRVLFSFHTSAPDLPCPYQDLIYSEAVRGTGFGDAGQVSKSPGI